MSNTEGERVQWDVEEHDSVRFDESLGVGGDLVHSLSLPDITKVLGPIRREGSLDWIN